MISKLANLFSRHTQSTLGQNIVTNYLAVVWLGFLGLAMMPIYVSILGPEQWGLVAVCIAAQGVMALLDAGLAQVMPRDMARVAGCQEDERRVFRVYAFIYLLLGIIGCAIAQFMVPILIEKWFGQGLASVPYAELALRFIFVQFMFQFANNAHRGYWSGVQLQKKVNVRVCVFMTFKHVGAYLSVLYISPSALGYIAPFVVVSLVEWILNRVDVVGVFNAFKIPVPSLNQIYKLARDAGGLSLTVLTGMIGSQLDRIFLSRYLEISEFGYYIVISTLGLAFMQLQYPLMKAFLPKVVRENDYSGLAVRLKVVTVCCVAPCVLIGSFAFDILNFWIDGLADVPGVLEVFQLMLAAVAINSLYGLVYQYILAEGDTRYLMLINVSTLLSIGISLFLLEGILGMIVGGFSWFLMALIQLSFGLYWLYKRKIK